jgi:hypothetical protein
VLVLLRSKSTIILLIAVMSLCAKVDIHPSIRFSRIILIEILGMNTGLKFGLDPKVLNSMCSIRGSGNSVTDYQ